MNLILLGLLLPSVITLQVRGNQQKSHLSNNNHDLDSTAFLTNVDPICNSERYEFQTRLTAINIASTLSSDISYDTSYQSSGYMSSEGITPIKSNANTKWVFSKILSGLIGSCGVLSLIAQSQKVVIYFEDLWSSQPGAGVCVFPMGEVVGQNIYNKMYSDLKAYAKTVSDSSQMTAGSYNGCIYLQNIKSKKTNGATQIYSQNLGSLHIQVLMSYQKMSSCYQLDVNVVISQRK